MSSKLIDLLFKAYRRRVLELLLMHTDKAYHVREIARLTNTVPGTLHKELTRLAEAGVLVQARQGNQVTYQANRNCLIYEELASIFRKTSGLADVLADALEPVAERIQLAQVFGSIASGNAIEDSDIDLLVVANMSFGNLVKALYPAQEILGREINPKLYRPKEWQAARTENSAFIRDILKKPTISVIGGKDGPGEFTGNKPGAR